MTGRRTTAGAFTLWLLNFLVLVGLVVAGLAVRLWVLRVNDELNADEVLPGLMGLHISQGLERPVFFYGQHYFGALEAYFIAGLFRLRGFDPWLMLVPPTAASLLLLPLTYALAARMGGKLAGLLACVPLAVPPPILAKLFTNAGGGFSLAFALHAAALLCCLQALEGEPRRWARPTLWLAATSLLFGFLCWVWQPALLLYPVMWLVVLLRRELWRRPHWLLVATAPLALGLWPPVRYNATQGWPTVFQVAAKYLAPANEAASGEWSGPRAVLTFLFTAFGGGNEAEGGANPVQGWLVALAFPLTILLLLRLAHRARGTPQHARWRQRRLDAAVLALAALVDVAAAHSTVRHLMPAALIGDAFAGAALALGPQLLRGVGRWPASLLSVAVLGLGVVGPNLWLDARADGIFQHFTASTHEVRAAVEALDAHGLSAGYSDYWTVYPIAYFSGERVTLAPRMVVVWGGRFDRYPAYSAAVDAVTDLHQLFMLLDDRCDLTPYVLLFEQRDAIYRIEHVGRWYLLWDIHPSPGAPEGEGASLLAAWRQVLSALETC